MVKLSYVALLKYSTTNVVIKKHEELQETAKQWNNFIYSLDSGNCTFNVLNEISSLYDHLFCL